MLEKAVTTIYAMLQAVIDRLPKDGTEEESREG
jgi:hypothetical protein